MSDATAALQPLTDARLAALPGFRHGFFSRKGGVSTGIYAGLNVGRGSGDAPDAVSENRRRAAAYFGQTEARLLTCHQVHSAIAVISDAPFGAARPQADAVVGQAANLIYGVLTADCAPILIADPSAHLAAAIHAGWKGALHGVIEDAIAKLVSLGGAPSQMVAAVGPCIGPASYEVGLEFYATFTRHDPASEAHFSPGASADKRQFDLPGFVRERLARSGVGSAAWIGHDTYADPQFFSNRRALHQGEGDYGRLLSAIMLV